MNRARFLYWFLSWESMFGVLLTVCNAPLVWPRGIYNSQYYMTGFVYVVGLSAYRKRVMTRNSGFSLEAPAPWKWFWRVVIIVNLVIYIVC